MKRTDILNYLAERHGLKRYLEIGVQVPEINFDRINCEYKVSVDPDRRAHATFCLTSDEYFDQVDKEVRFDLIFLDGLHHADQLERDLFNAKKILEPGGFIVMHDCNPIAEHHTIVPRPTPTGHWNGDCYKVACDVRQILKQTVDIDNGCCIVRPRPEEPVLSTLRNEVSWPAFNANRKRLLNLITWDEFISSTLPYVQ